MSLAASDTEALCRRRDRQLRYGAVASTAPYGIAVLVAAGLLRTVSPSAPAKAGGTGPRRSLCRRPRQLAAVRAGSTTYRFLLSLVKALRRALSPPLIAVPARSAAPTHSYRNTTPIKCY